MNDRDPSPDPFHCWVFIFGANHSFGCLSWVRSIAWCSETPVAMALISWRHWTQHRIHWTRAVLSDGGRKNRPWQRKDPKITMNFWFLGLKFFLTFWDSKNCQQLVSYFSQEGVQAQRDWIYSPDHSGRLWSQDLSPRILTSKPIFILLSPLLHWQMEKKVWGVRWWTHVHTTWGGMELVLEQRSSDSKFGVLSNRLLPSSESNFWTTSFDPEEL